MPSSQEYQPSMHKESTAMGGKSLAALIATGILVSACGGGGGSSTSSSGGGTPQNEPPPPPPEPGLDAGDNPNNEVWVDEEVRAAIMPAYVTMGMVQLAADTAEGAGAYQTRLDEAFADGYGVEAIPCDSGDLTVLAWDDPDGDGQLSAGDSVDFDFGDCSFTSTQHWLRSPAPTQTLEVTGSGGRFLLDGVEIGGYPSLRATGVDVVWDGSHLAGGSASAVSAAGNGYLLTLGEDGDGTPLAIDVTDNADGTKTVSIDDVRVTIDNGTSSMEYLVSTTSPITIAETTTGWEVVDAEAGEAVDGGSFVVQDLTNNVRYRYTLAVDPTCLWAAIDNDGDGAAEAEGQIDQNLIMDRLALD